MTKMLHFIDLLNEYSGKIFGFAIIPMTIFASLEVFLRYVFERPTIWAWDVNGQLLAIMVVMCGGYALLNGLHVKVDVIVGRIPPRIGTVIDLLTALLFFFLCYVAISQCWHQAWTSVAIRETKSSIWGPPIYPLKVMFVVGCLLLFLQGLAKFVRDIQCLLHTNGGGVL